MNIYEQLEQVGIPVERVVVAADHRADPSPSPAQQAADVERVADVDGCDYEELPGKRAAADFAPGLPRRKNFGNLSKLTPGEQYDLFVQKHDALRAGPHYDYRFGTPDTGLYSWAVRKGLPAPGARHLAVMQPVHRHAYGKWEGTIPAGQYGAGAVTQHTAGKVIINSIRPGLISLTRIDKKYPERFVLVQPRKGARQRDWLLINTTPTEPLPYTKIRYGKVPVEKVESTLAAMSPGSSVQAKVDGASSLIKLLNNGVEIVSYRASAKSGHPIVHTERFFGGPGPKMQIPPHLVGTVLKGELYGRRRNGTASIAGVAAGTSAGNAGDVRESDDVYSVLRPQELSAFLNSSVGRSITRQRAGGVQLRNMLYDVQQVGKNPVDTDAVPYAERYKLLQTLAPILGKHFEVAEQMTEPQKALELWQRIQAGKHPMTTEGIVIHPPKGKPLKAKRFTDYDVHVRGMYPGKNSRAATVGGFEYALQPDGPVVGRVGGGFDAETLADMATNPSDWVGRVAKVRAQEQLSSGALRVPSFLSLHEDYPLAKTAEELNP